MKAKLILLSFLSLLALPACDLPSYEMNWEECVDCDQEGNIHESTEPAEHSAEGSRDDAKTDTTHSPR